MSVKQYILFLASGTSIAACAWFVVLISINPVTAGLFGFLSFYTTFGIMSVGLFAILGTIVRTKGKEQHDLKALMQTSLRQAILLTILLEAVLILLSKGYLSTSMLILCISGISLIEYVLLFKTKNVHSHS